MFDWSDTVFGEEMWRLDAYQIPYYSRGIEGEKRTHPRFADWCMRLIKQNIVTESGGNEIPEEVLNSGFCSVCFNRLR
jgi:hypothetical protein